MRWDCSDAVHSIDGLEVRHAFAAHVRIADFHLLVSDVYIAYLVVWVRKVDVFLFINTLVSWVLEVRCLMLHIHRLIHHAVIAHPRRSQVG